MKVIRKSEYYPLEKVQERILYYENRIDELENPALISINCKLLAFWIQYKHKNYSDAQTRS